MSGPGATGADMIKLITGLLVGTILTLAVTTFLFEGKRNAASVDGSVQGAAEERILLAPNTPRGQRGEGFGWALKGEGYELSADWFSEKAPAWEVALAPFKGKPGVQYLEVGVYEGMSVSWMLENILTDPTSQVTAVDIFFGTEAESVNGFSQDLRERFLRNIERAGGADRIRVVTDFSQLALRTLPLNHYDIIYIDGSHMGPDVLEDAILAFRLLKENGVLIFDDYRWLMKRPIMDRPKYALDQFVEFYGDQFDYLHNGAQLILRRNELDFVSTGMGADRADTGMPSMPLAE
jgi:predicted O-methyltransferase YrrM